MSVFDITYTADWDGEWLSVVAEVTSTIDNGGLQSSLVLGPIRCQRVTRVRMLLLKEGYVPEDVYASIERNTRFVVKKI